jgi:2-oxoglutarate ferredoxin oxidoreductase subunit alpha
VADTFTETVRAFNLSERFRTPVSVLLDEVIAHSREIIAIPEKGEIELVERVKATVPPEEFEPFAMTPNMISPMPAYGEGYRFHVTGLTHDTMGFSTNEAAEIGPKLDKLRNKIMNYTAEIEKLRVEMMEDAEIAFVSYGSVSRTTLQAASLARSAGFKVGCVQLCTIWPFPDDTLKEVLSGCRKVIVGELNMGQVVHEIRRILPDAVEVHSVLRYDGEIITPAQLLEKLEEVL